MGTHMSPLVKVLEVLAKWTRPARSPTDLQVSLKTLSTTPTTMEDPGRPYPDPGASARVRAQGELLVRGLAPLVALQIAGFTL
jgi:hypothetical protein